MADSKPIVVASTVRGLDERWDPSGSAGISASIAQDLWYDPRGGWQTAGGYRRITRGPTVEGSVVDPFSTLGPIESIHYFTQHNGSRRWLVYIDASNGYLYQFNQSTAARSGSPGDRARDRTGAQVTLTTVPGPWQRSQSACWGDVMYLVNGIDRPLVFDGYVWDYAGWTGPAGAPTATLMSVPIATDYGGAAAVKIPNIGLGDTSETPGDDYKFARRYRVAFINNRGAISPWSEASEVVYGKTVGGTDSYEGAQFAKLDIPVGPPSTVARIVSCTVNLYDTSNVLIQGRDNVFLQWGVVGDNVTTTIQDGLADGYLGSVVDLNAYGPWPTNTKLIGVFNGRMYAAGAGNSLVYFSEKGNPEVWPVDNVLDVGDAHLGPITAMYASRNALIVAKSRGIYLVKEEGANGPVAQTLTRQTGWISQNTVREIPSLGVIGLSDDGVMLLKGTLQNEGVETQVFNTATALSNTIASINLSAAANACGAVYHKDKEYWLSIPTVGNQNNNLVLVFHYEIREWTTRPAYPIASMLETPDTGTLLFGSYAATTAVSPDGVAHKGIFFYSRSNATKDGTALKTLYRTNAISIASAYRTFRPLHVLTDAILHGNAVQVQMYGNYNPKGWFDKARKTPQYYPQEPNTPFYGTAGTGNPATFDTGRPWQNWHPGTLRTADVTQPSAQPVFACQIEWSPTNHYMTLCGFSLEVQPGDPIQTKPLLPDGAS